jgi:hypothetical protein
MIRMQAHQTINQATINQSNRLDHVSPYAAPGWAGHPLDLHQSRCSEASSEPECRTVSSPNQTVSPLLKPFIDIHKLLGQPVAVRWSDSKAATCYIYGLCLPLWTYLLTDKWVTVWKHLGTSLGTPLCILFRLFLTHWHLLTLLGVCTVNRTLLTEGSASTSALDSCMVQEISMADESTSEVLQTCVQYMEIPLVDGRHTIYSVLYMATPHRSYLYLR